MLAKDKVENILKLYNQMFREEEDTAILSKFLVENKDLYNRKNFNGHITSSAFLLNKEASHILLLFHETLHQWFQPGGHVEIEDETIIAGSRRELAEETPFQNFSIIHFSDELHLPIDIDSHIIPTSIKKKENAHYHHDFRYLFKLDQTIDIDRFNQENSNFKWISLRKLLEMNGFEKPANKIMSISTV